MAFNIMDLFGPGAMNRLLQPIQNTQGIQNMLANPQAAPPMASPVNVPQQQVAEAAQVDPWAGLREVSPGLQDPMQTAAVPQQQPAVAVPDKPGGLDKYTRDIFRENLNQFFIGMASGRTPAESLSMGAMAANAKHNDMKNANQTVAWLQSKGMDKEQAWQLASSPPALGDYLKKLSAGADPMKALELEKAQLEVANLRNPASKLTDDQREYEASVAQGYKGTFPEYQIMMKEAGRNKIDINTGVKLPSGYEWLDPNDQGKGVKPIAGGPATQLPGELAARIGLADNWLKNDLPTVKTSVDAGEVTGPVDRFQAANNQKSPQATTYRKIQSGVEVLSRLLSGAGMTQVEIDEKTARYQPTYTDDAASMSSKIDQLAQEIKATRDSALQGRGGPIAGQTSPAGGVVDYTEYFKGP